MITIDGEVLKLLCGSRPSLDAMPMKKSGDTILTTIFMYYITKVFTWGIFLHLIDRTLYQFLRGRMQ